MIFNTSKTYKESIKDVHKTIANRASICAFIVVLAAGFIVHSGAINNFIINWDSMIIDYGADWAIKQGKWFYPVIALFRGSVDMALVEAPIAILFCGISAYLLVELFHIKSKVIGGLIGFCLMVFPSLAVIMVYSFEDAFLFSLLLSVIAAFLIRKSENCNGVKKVLVIIIAIISLVISLGTYQAYIGFTIGILIILTILDLLNISKHNQKDILKYKAKSVMWYIIYLAISIALYYVVTKLIWYCTGLSASFYKGINGVFDGSSLTIGNILDCIFAAYSNFFNCILCDKYGTGEYRFRIVGIATLLLDLLILVVAILKNKTWYNKISLLFIMLLIALLPLGINAIEVLSLGNEQYFIVLYPVVLVYLLPLVLLDREFILTNGTDEALRSSIFPINSSVNSLLSLVVVVACCFTLFNWYLFDTRAYSKIQLSYEKLYAQSVGIANRIISTEGYNKGSQIAIAGVDEYSKKPELLPTLDFVPYGRVTGLASSNNILQSVGSWNYYMKYYLGYDFKAIDADFIPGFKGSPTEANMGAFPAYSCIQYVGNYLVIKLA